MKISVIFALILLLLANVALCQNEGNDIKLYVSTGYGYFNDEGMQDGQALLGEIGLKLNTGYLFSVQAIGGETINDKGDWPSFNGDKFEFLYTYKILCLNTGYEFITKNQHHSFIPMVGGFISNNRIVYPTQYENYLDISLDEYFDIGAMITLKYAYNFNSNISVGLQASTNIAVQMGFLYYSVFPVITIKY